MDVARSESIFCWPRTRFVLDLLEERRWLVAELRASFAGEDATPLVCEELAVVRCETPVFFCAAEFVLRSALDVWAGFVVAASLEEVCCRAFAEATTTHINNDAISAT